MRWWTSDLHLGHANICAYSGRPYREVEDMNLDVIERWNDRVAPGDEVYVLGDVVMGHIAETLPLVELLLGVKRLAPGNHDRCWVGNRNKKKHSVDKWSGEYAAVGFTIVEGPAAVGLGGCRVVADHFPYRGDSQDEERYTRCPARRGWARPADAHAVISLLELTGLRVSEATGANINIGSNVAGARVALPARSSDDATRIRGSAARSVARHPPLRA